jgi:hypothetical protein
VKLRRHDHPEVSRIEDNLAAVCQKTLNPSQEIGETVESPDQTDAMHEQENRVKSISGDRIETPASSICDAPATHHLDRLGRNVDRGDLETAFLELESVPPRARTEIKNPTPAEMESGYFEIR